MDLDEVNAAYQEHYLMHRTRHRSILKLYHVFEDTNFICLVFEIMSSDLRKIMTQLDKRLHESQIRKIFY